VPPGRGNIKTLLDTVNSSQKQCFGYDGLDRLTTAYTTSSGPYNQAVQPDKENLRPFSGVVTCAR